MKTITMSAPVPVIYNDSMFESDLPAPAPHVVSKLETIDELSCHLPTTGATHAVEGGDVDTSPILIHSEVLDSVFSTNLDVGDQVLDDTPMFDELDFIMDGSKVNSRDDWVSLFKEEPVPDVAASIMPDQEENLEDLFADDIKESYDDYVPVSKQVEQLETPATPVLRTPVIDGAVVPADSVNRVSKKSKVDHLGCVSYSKKQRSQPLKPIKIDGEDPVAAKRARNTEAARRSRARKMERMNQLEDKVEALLLSKKDLQDEVDRLKAILTANNVSF